MADIPLPSPPDYLPDYSGPAATMPVSQDPATAANAAILGDGHSVAQKPARTDRQNPADFLSIPPPAPDAPPSSIDIATGRKTTIPEATAWGAFQTLKANPKVLDEPQPDGTTLRARLTDTVSSYYDERKANNQKPFPTYAAEAVAARNAHHEKLFSGLDKLDAALSPEQKAALDDRAKLAPDPDAYRARAINFQYLRDLGTPVTQENYPIARSAYAVQLGLPAEADDKALYNAIGNRQRVATETTKTLSKAIQKAAQTVLMGDGRPEIREQQLKDLLAATPDEHKSFVRQQFTNSWKDARDLARQAKPVVDQIMPLLLEGATAKEGSLKDTFGSHFEKAGAMLPADQPGGNPMREAVLAQLEGKMKAINPEDYAGFSRFYEALAQGTGNIARGTFDMGVALRQWSDETAKKAGMTIPGTDTRENAAAAHDDARKMRNLTAATAGSFRRKDDGYIRNTILSGIESLPYTLLAFEGPAGFGLMASSMGGQSFQDARQANPKASPARQAEAALVSGAIQAQLETVMDRFGLKLVKMKVPGLFAALNKSGVTNAIGRAAIAGTAAVVGIEATEYSEEVAQQATDRKLQDIALSLSGIDPNTNWKGFFHDWNPLSGSKVSMDTLGVAFMYALIGGGVASFQNYRFANTLQRSTPMLRSLGLPEERVQAIATAPTLEDATTELRSAWRDGLDLAAATKQREKLSAIAEETAAFYGQSPIQVIQPENNDFTGETQFQLNLPDAPPRVFQTLDEAFDALRDFHANQLGDDLDTLNDATRQDLIDFMTGEYSAAANIRITDRSKLAITPDEAVKQGLATQEQITERLRIHAMQEGVDVADLDLSALRIHARRFSERMRDGSLRQTVEYFQGADPINVAEDIAETYWTSALDEGLLRHDEIVGWIRQAEQVTGNSYLDPNHESIRAKTDLTPDQQKAVDDRAKLQLSEALSAFSREYLAGNVADERLPEKFRRWLHTLIAYAAHKFRHAATLLRSKPLMDAVKAGKIDSRFVAHIADSVGLNQAETDRRFQKDYQAQLAAEAMGGMPEISEAARGMLPHPETARQRNAALTGELQRLYDSLKTPTRRRRKDGSTIDSTQRANSFFLPIGEWESPDDVRQSLNEKGFAFDTPAALLSALDDSLNYNLKSYATQGGMLDQSFSVGRTNVFPTAGTRSLDTNDGRTLTGPATFSISAHHGTPHKVDRFSLDKIGTGEGAQAYGYGLYFAGNPNVAKAYARTYARGEISTAEDAARLALSLEQSPASAIEALKALDIPGLKNSTLVDDAVRLVESGAVSTGNLYTVTLDVNDEDLLDWDKPFSEQPESLRKAFAAMTEVRVRPYGPNPYGGEELADVEIKLPGGQWSAEGAYPLQKAKKRLEDKQSIIDDLRFSGESIYDIIMRTKRDAAEVSQYLNDLGVPGIRYLDGNSRAQGQGSSNYVLFDESKIQITEENGKPVTMADQSFSIGPVTADLLGTDYSGNTVDSIGAGNPFSIGKMNIENAVKEARKELDQCRAARDEISVTWTLDHKRLSTEGDEMYFPEVKLPKEDAYLEQFLSLDPIGKGADGKWYFGEKPTPFNSLQEAQDFGFEEIRDALKKEAPSSTFGSDADAQEMTANIFSAFPNHPAITKPWEQTKWGSWYLEFRDENGDRQKISVRDHGATRADMGLPDRSFYVSKQWNPEEVGKVLIAAADYLENKTPAQSADAGRNMDKSRETSASGLESRQSQDSGKLPDGAHPSTSFSLSASAIGDLEKLIAQKLTEGPAERAQILQTLRNRLAGVLQRQEDIANGVHPLLKRGSLDPVATDRLRQRELSAQIHAIISAFPPEVRGKVNFDSTTLLDADGPRSVVNAMKSVINRLDEALEPYLQEQYLDALAKLIDLGSPVRKAGETSKSKLTPETQRTFDLAVDATRLTPSELSARLIGTEAAIAELSNNPDADGKELVRQTLTLNFLETFGALHTRSAAELEHAHQQLLSIYSSGRMTRRILDDAQREERAAWRKEILESLGLPYGANDHQHTTGTSKKGLAAAGEMLQSLRLGMSSFHQVMEWILPKSTTARMMQAEERKAATASTRLKLEAHDRFNEFFATRMGLKTRRQRNALLARLSERNDTDIRLLEGIRSKSEKLTIEQAQRVLRGQMNTGWENDRIAMESLRQAYAEYQLLPKKNRDAREFIRFDRVTQRGNESPLVASQLELLNYHLTAQQAEYLPALDKWGFTEDVLTAIKDKLEPETLALAEFLATEYADGYHRLNPVHRAVTGMDMPQIRNYSPGRFENAKGSANDALDAFGSTLASPNALAAGFTKNRKAHMARPQKVSALASYWGHVATTSHFIAYAELCRDMGAAFKTPEIRRAIEARFGKKIAGTFSQWLDAIALDGQFQATVSLASAEIGQRALAGQAAIGLAYNLGVLLKQASAGLGFLMEMPLKDAAKGLMLSLSNPQALTKLWNTETIQQRIEDGFSPEDRQLLTVADSKPSLILDLLAAGRLPIAWTDAAMTTISGSVAYQFHRAEALKQGLNEQQAEEIGLAAMDRVIFRTAQPNRTAERSLDEITTAHPFMRTLFQFKSDPRQKFALATEAIAKAIRGDITKGEAAKKLIVTWALYGLMAQVAADVWKGISRDDDDDDYQNWQPKDYLAAMIAGPIAGVTYLGSAADFLIHKLITRKAFTNSATPIEGALAAGLAQISKASSHPEKIDLNDIVSLTRSLGLLATTIDPRAAIVPVALKAARDTYGIAENAGDTFFGESPAEQMHRIIREAKTADKKAKETADPKPLTDRQRARKKVLDGLTPQERSLKKLPEAIRKDAIEKILQTLPENERESYKLRLQNAGL
jgi:hypothetical protein